MYHPLLSMVALGVVLDSVRRELHRWPRCSKAVLTIIILLVPTVTLDT